MHHSAGPSRVHRKAVLDRSPYLCLYTEAYIKITCFLLVNVVYVTTVFSLFRILCFCSQSLKVPLLLAPSNQHQIRPKSVPSRQLSLSHFTTQYLKALPTTHCFHFLSPSSPSLAHCSSESILSKVSSALCG